MDGNWLTYQKYFQVHADDPSVAGRSGRAGFPAARAQRQFRGGGSPSHHLARWRGRFRPVGTVPRSETGTPAPGPRIPRHLGYSCTRPVSFNRARALFSLRWPTQQENVTKLLPALHQSQADNSVERELRSWLAPDVLLLAGSRLPLQKGLDHATPMP